MSPAPASLPSCCACPQLPREADSPSSGPSHQPLLKPSVPMLFPAPQPATSPSPSPHWLPCAHCSHQPLVATEPVKDGWSESRCTGHIKHTWASEDGVRTECGVSHCCFGYVGLIEMYLIQLLFSKVTAKCLGSMPVAHISPSATHALRWRPQVRSTPSLLSLPLVGSLKNPQGSEYLCTGDAHPLPLAPDRADPQPPPSLHLGPHTHPGWARHGTPIPSLEPTTLLAVSRPHSRLPEHSVCLALDIHTRGVPQTLLSLARGWAPRSSPSLGTGKWRRVKSAPPHPLRRLLPCQPTPTAM